MGKEGRDFSAKKLGGHNFIKYSIWLRGQEGKGEPSFHSHRKRIGGILMKERLIYFYTFLTFYVI